MTKLLKSLIITKKNECDEWTINSHYNPKGYIDIIILCSIINNQPLEQTEIEHINNQIKQYYKYQLLGNKTKTRETLNQIQNNLTKHTRQIITFLKTYEQTKLTTDTHPEAYNIYSFGVLSFEWSD